jgi:hypothetical protein
VFRNARRDAHSPILSSVPTRWLPNLDQLPFDRRQISKLRRVVGHRRQRLTQ